MLKRLIVEEYKIQAGKKTNYLPEGSKISTIIKNRRELENQLGYLLDCNNIDEIKAEIRKFVLKVIEQEKKYQKVNDKGRRQQIIKRG